MNKKTRRMSRRTKRRIKKFMRWLIEEIKEVIVIGTIMATPLFFFVWWLAFGY